MDKTPFRSQEPDDPSPSGSSGSLGGEPAGSLDPLELSLAMLTAARDVKVTADTALEWVRLAVAWGAPAGVQALLDARDRDPGRTLAIAPSGEIGQMDSLFFQDLRELDPRAAALIGAIASGGGTPVLFLKTLPYLVLELGEKNFTDPAASDHS
jgi:hypothetical protein